MPQINKKYNKKFEDKYFDSSSEVIKNKTKKRDTQIIIKNPQAQM